MTLQDKARAGQIKARVRTPELEYSAIRVSAGEIAAARGVVAANSLDAQDARLLLEHLGLMPDQTDWYKGDEDGSSS